MGTCSYSLVCVPDPYIIIINYSYWIKITMVSWLLPRDSKVLSRHPSNSQETSTSWKSVLKISTSVLNKRLEQASWKSVLNHGFSSKTLGLLFKTCAELSRALSRHPTLSQETLTSWNSVLKMQISVLNKRLEKASWKSVLMTAPRSMYFQEASVIFKTPHIFQDVMKIFKTPFKTLRYFSRHITFFQDTWMIFKTPFKTLG